MSAEGASDEASPVEAIVKALVREYLFRTGHRDVLEVFDRHGPRATPMTTSELVKSLRLVKLYKRNCDREDPFKSVLEVMTHYFLHEAVHAEKAAEKAASAPKAEQPPQPPAAAAPSAAAPIPPPSAAAAAVAVTAPAGNTAAAGGGFFARLAASKAAAAAAGASAAAVQPPPQPPPLTASVSTEGVPSEAPVPTAVSGPSVPPTASTSPSSQPGAAAGPAPAPPSAPLVPTPGPTPVPPSAAPAPAPAMSFFERIAANKAAAAAAAAPGPSPAPPATQSAPVATPASQTSASSRTAVSAAPAPAMSFFERLAANKAAAAAAAAAGSTGAAPTSAPATAAAAVAPAAPTAAPAFVAPDGRGFSDRTEYRRYLSENFYTFAGRTGETLTKAPGEIAGQMFLLRDLTDCVVRLCDHSETVQMDRLTRCKVLIGSSCESVFMRNCVDCTFSIACKQLRTRDCARCITNLYAKTDPIIEKSYAMEFRPFNAAYPGLRGHFAAARLEPQYNHWRRIFDFSADDAVMPRPHWTIGDVSLAITWTIDDLPAAATRGLPPENPVPADAAPRAEGGRGDVAPSRGAAAATDLLAFDIRSTSQAAAQAALERAEATATPAA